MTGGGTGPGGGAGAPGPAPTRAPRPPGGEAAGLALALLATLALAAWVGAAHPGLRLVDVVGFADRARRLAALDPGAGMDPLYPLGYPALLALGHTLTGGVGWVARGASVAAALGLVLVVGRRLGAGAALWMVGCPALVQLSTTEGTDLPAAALCLCAALLAAGPGEEGAAASRRVDAPWGRGLAAGLLLGAAVLTRYTAWVAVAPILLFARGRTALLPGLLLAAGLHLGGAAWAGRAPWPDQSLNLAIGAGGATELLSMETLRRWPLGVARAAGDAVLGGVGALGLLGLGLAAGARGAGAATGGAGRRAALLVAGVGLAHLAALGVAFSNPRLAAPAALAGWLGVALGVGALPGAARVWGARLLGIVGLGVGVWAAARSAAAVEEGDRVAAVTALAGPTPCVATSPWFHGEDQGWLVPSVQLSGLRVDPRSLDPGRLAALLDREGLACVALDAGRTRRGWPGLGPLLEEEGASGWRLRGAAEGWWVWERAR